MIEKLKQMLGSTFGVDSASLMEDQEHARLLAAVALMVEIIAVDDEQHEAEKAMLRQLVVERFNMDQDKADALIQQAETALQESTDFYHFTSTINREFSDEEKVELMASLWQLSYADEHIHELEQHVIRKLARLLHVSHKDFITTKLKVIEGQR